MIKPLRVVVLLNAAAGTLEHQDATVFRGRLISAFAERGFPPNSSSCTVIVSKKVQRTL